MPGNMTVYTKQDTLEGKSLIYQFHNPKGGSNGTNRNGVINTRRTQHNRSC